MSQPTTPPTTIQPTEDTETAFARDDRVVLAVQPNLPPGTVTAVDTETGYADVMWDDDDVPDRVPVGDLKLLEAPDANEPAEPTATDPAAQDDEPVVHTVILDGVDIPEPTDVWGTGDPDDRRLFVYAPFRERKAGDYPYAPFRERTDDDTPWYVVDPKTDPAKWDYCGNADLPDGAQLLIRDGQVVR